MIASPLFLFLHLVGVIVWVGGMFFAYVCLRPAAAGLLEPPQRLGLWSAVFARFFPAVWLAVVAILLTGSITLAGVGFRSAPIHWHLMLASGLVMIGIFGHVYFVAYRRLRAAVERSDWKAGGAALNVIRQWVGINLILGFVTVALATLGRHLA